jgi:hypothetical protein
MLLWPESQEEYEDAYAIIERLVEMTPENVKRYQLVFGDQVTAG